MRLLHYLCDFVYDPTYIRHTTLLYCMLYIEVMLKVTNQDKIM